MLRNANAKAKENTMTSYTTISIRVNGTWAGSGKVINGSIVDCGAQFCDDNDKSMEVYELIEEAIERGDDNIGVETESGKLDIAWDITEPATEDISDDLHEEIVEAVLDATLCCEESVCDACLAVAKTGGDWRAELAKAKANDAAERKALGIN